MLAELYCVKGREAGKALELSPGSSVSCGRALSNDLRVRDPQVSRIHCRIECGEHEVRLKDSSGNGTYVNDSRIQGEVALKDGDRVRLGSTELRILIETEAEAVDHDALLASESEDSTIEERLEETVEDEALQLDDEEETVEDEDDDEDKRLFAASGITPLPPPPPPPAKPPSATFAATVPPTGESATPLANPNAFRSRARRSDPPPPPSARTSSQAVPPPPASTAPLGHTPRAAPRHDETPSGSTNLREIIPGYRIEAKLSGGGRRGTVVYRALQLSLDRSVALKVLLPAAAAREAELGRFLRESAAIARLPHPNIVTIHDAGRSGDRRFIVMELLTGGSVVDRLDDGGSFGQEEALALGLDVARGLAFAHGHGIVHRGIRPANVLRDAFGTWKLVDFGSTRDLLRGSGGETSFLDTPPEILGYVAPEQLERGGGDARSDVYGLGAVLYHALAGRAPFVGSTLGEFVRNLSESVEPPLDPLVAAARGPLVTVVRRCLERDPAKKYPNGDAALHELLAAKAADTPRHRPTKSVKPS